MVASEEHVEPKAQPVLEAGQARRKSQSQPLNILWAEKLTLSVSPGILCALFMFGVKTGVCQLFMSQKQGIFSPRIASAVSFAHLGEDAGFS